MKRLVDLRTDTSSSPTEGMRDAMRDAEVGNDEFREDPSINKLEALAAEKLGKEAGLFLASGTMANLVALMTFCGPGDSLIVGSGSHITLYERAVISKFGGIMPLIVDDDLGRLDIGQIERRFAAKSNLDIKLIALENTHNSAGGVVLTPDDMIEYRRIADKHGTVLYVDGARIFNSAVAQGIPAKDLARDADALMFCLSKGLCAPVGSVLVGTIGFIDHARETRAMLGGQMRKAGILAAAGCVALENMIGELAKDHEKAAFLGNELAGIEGIIIDPRRVQTNIVLADISPLAITADEFAQELEGLGVCLSVFTDRAVRFITYRDIAYRDLEYTLEAVKKIVKQLASRSL